MNIYFTGSIVGKRQYEGHYSAIIEHLKAEGHTVQADHIMNADESQIRIESREDRLKFHKTLERWIQKADFVIAEASFPSISVGYEISLALNNRKPVLILYAEGDPPSLMRHHSDEKIVCERYTKSNVGDILDDFVAFAQGSSDTRFTFFITPRIAAYMERIAKEQKIPKSVYLRRLIEQEMSKE